MYQFWSWVPDDTLRPGDGLYCAMPLFHNSGRSAFNYAMAHGARFVIRDQFSATDVLGRRPRHRLRHRRARRADDRVARTPRLRADDDADTPAAQRDPRPDDPGDGRVRDAASACGWRRATARPRSVWPSPPGGTTARGPNCGRRARGLPVARGAHRRRARRAGCDGRDRRAGRAQRRAVGAERRATTACPSRPRGPGATAGSTPATRSGATTTAGTTSSTDCATRSGGGARTSRRSRSRRCVAEHPDVVRVRGDRRARGARRRRRDGGGDRARPVARSIPAELLEFLEPEDAPLHAAALRGGGRRPPPHRGVDAGAQARAARTGASPPPPGIASRSVRLL